MNADSDSIFVLTNLVSKIYPQSLDHFEFDSVSAVPVNITSNTLTYSDNTLMKLREYVVFSPSDINLYPIFSSKTANQNLHGLSVPELLIVTHPSLLSEANRLANYLGRDLTITSGYRPGARGAHGADGGNAFDLGYGANGRIPLDLIRNAYRNVFNASNSMAIKETGCYHFQLQPGRGGATGFLPGLRNKYGQLVGN